MDRYKGLSIEWKVFIPILVLWFALMILYAENEISYLAWIIGAGIPIIGWLYWTMYLHMDEYIEQIFVMTGIDMSGLLQPQKSSQ